MVDWIDRINSELLNILMSYAQERFPRAKASYLLIAIGRLIPHASSKSREKLEELAKKVKEVSYAFNWELYMAYSFGKYELLDDEQYSEMVQHLAVLDDVAMELSHILGEIYIDVLRELEEAKKKSVF